MQSKAKTVEAYLAELPAERRAAVSTVRDVIRKSLEKDYEEGMYYGMIMWYVPHRLFPAGYHCDPSKPLGVAALASQKQYMSVYLDPSQHASWFREAWAKAGKTLDMGKSCVRFKRVEDLALDVIAELMRRTPVKAHVENYLAGRLAMSEGARSRKAKAKPGAKKARLARRRKTSA